MRLDEVSHRDGCLGMESLSAKEHGLFFDAMQRLGLRNEVKQAAFVIYLAEN